jgi:hypothetical protein
MKVTVKQHGPLRGWRVKVRAGKPTGYQSDNDNFCKAIRAGLVGAFIPEGEYEVLIVPKEKK